MRMILLGWHVHSVGEIRENLAGNKGYGRHGLLDYRSYRGRLFLHLFVVALVESGRDRVQMILF